MVQFIFSSIFPFGENYFVAIIILSVKSAKKNTQFSEKNWVFLVLNNFCNQFKSLLST
jgi:uncharacterized membrane protein